MHKSNKPNKWRHDRRPDFNRRSGRHSNNANQNKASPEDIKAKIDQIMSGPEDQHFKAARHWSRLANLKAEQGKQEEAYKHLEKARECNPQKSNEYSLQEAKIALLNNARARAMGILQSDNSPLKNIENPDIQDRKTLLGYLALHLVINTNGNTFIPEKYAMHLNEQERTNVRRSIQTTRGQLAEKCKGSHFPNPSQQHLTRAR